MIDTINFDDVKWYHVFNPTDADYTYLMDTFDFHPLDIEDCKSSNQRPKIDEYDEYYFIILHFPYFDKTNKFIRLKEVKIFWGKDYIITLGSSHWVVKNMFNEMKNNRQQLIDEKAKRDNDPEDDSLDIIGSSDALLYNLLDRLMVETYSLILRIGTDVDNLNTDIFSKKAQMVLEHLTVTRKNLVSLNTSFKPQLKVFHMFESGSIKGYQEDMEEYWGNILDQYQRMFDLVEDYGELTNGLAQTFDSLQANKANQTNKALTIISTVMLPMTVVSSIYGMNVDLPFQNNPNAFWYICIIMIVIVATFWTIFKRNGWS